MIENIVLSLQDKYTELILSGVKSVELRRRSVLVVPGTRIWIYSKKPVGATRIVTTVASIVRSSPNQIWKEFGSRTGITRKEFDSYFEGTDVASAIVLSKVSKLRKPVLLSDIRRKNKDFHPPQFFKRLAPDSLELSLFRAAL